MAAISGAQTNQLVSAVLTRLGNNELHTTITNDIPSLAKNVIEQVDAEGKIGIVNIGPTSVGSTTFLPSAGALPSGAAINPSQGTVLAAVVFSRLAIDRKVFNASSDIGDGLDIIKAQYDFTMDDLKARFGRALFRNQLDPDGYSGSGIGGGATLTFNTGTGAEADGVYEGAFTDLSGFRFNQAVQTTHNGKLYVLLVNDISPAAVGSLSSAVAGIVEFKNAVPGVAGASGHGDADLGSLTGSVDHFWLRGTYDEDVSGVGTGSTATLAVSALPNSFYDISGTGTLHGLAATGGWKGIQKLSFGALTQEKLLSAAAQSLARTGQSCSHLILHPVAGAVYASDSINSTAGAGGGGRKVIDSKMSKYDAVMDEWESGVQFMAKPVIYEPNCPAQAAVLHSKPNAQLFVWKDFDFEREAGEIAMIDRNRYILDVQISAEMNLAVRSGKRGSIVWVDGITGL